MFVPASLQPLDEGSDPLLAFLPPRVDATTAPGWLSRGVMFSAFGDLSDGLEDEDLDDDTDEDLNGDYDDDLDVELDEDDDLDDLEDDDYDGYDEDEEDGDEGYDYDDYDR